MGGDEIRKIREAAGLTQEQLAFQTRLHRTYISMVERDINSLTLPSLFRICKAVGVRPSLVVSHIEKSTGAIFTKPTSARARPKPKGK